MKNYDNMDNFRTRTHTIQITLQTGKYKGHIAYQVGGNCFGLDLLRHFDFDDENANVVDIYGMKEFITYCDHCGKERVHKTIEKAGIIDRIFGFDYKKGECKTCRNINRNY